MDQQFAETTSEVRATSASSACQNHQTGVTPVFGDVDTHGDHVRDLPTKIDAGPVPEHRELPTTSCVNRGRPHNLLMRGRSRSRGSSLWSEAAPSTGTCAAPASTVGILPDPHCAG
jgi:hypothetical protein